MSAIAQAVARDHPGAGARGHGARLAIRPVPSVGGALFTLGPCRSLHRDIFAKTQGALLLDREIKTSDVPEIIEWIDAVRGGF